MKTLKITLKDVRDYRKLVKKNWHDQEWFEKKNSYKNDLIEMAIADRQIGWTDRDVINRSYEIDKMLNR